MISKQFIKFIFLLLCIDSVIKLINWLLIGFVNFLIFVFEIFFMNLFNPVYVTVIIRCLVLKPG